MAVPHLKKSLCGISVESGSKIIGFTSLVLRSLLILLLIIYCLILANAEKKVDLKFTPSETGGHFHQNAMMNVTMNVETTGAKTINNMLLIVIVIVIVQLLIHCIFDVLMLIGVYKRQPSFIFAWIVVQIIAIISGILNLFLSYNVPGILIQTILSIVFTIYFTLVVNSHYQNLKTGQQQNI
ncbi:hypothetical protein LSTR_LSTR003146 [Laodelphax striatellus]|uniref:Uncharacterized protein n=1 Tax=Laodelphax striatellus TaxID=195883 RepID=A0A482WW71_LAOST|nr:hypothetical protein LSTR_LSTR003146 [Laodelphax striatellus]